ncbi:TolC family protein [uncultured Thiohalocapsa sp.]|uniref:TolC family protein n=1 Tax=uncultured Thiohalocapsa sp. TaxID=768990 RepID=UPI0025F438CE|nr:TolC family protein [uncultured Thiohalocapsa sp.]
MHLSSRSARSRCSVPRLPCLLAALLGLAAGAAVAAPPPDPLRLADALGFADDHPRVQLGADAVLPPRSQPLFLGCHTLAFDNARPGDAARDVAWSPLLPAVDAQRLAIMQRFFDVLLADLSYMRDNEAMAVAYIQFDRAENRRELGQTSALTVAELEAAYQLIRRRRAASDAARRVTRSLLAQALGTPEDLPKNLVDPPPAADLPPQELDAVVAAALSDNPRVQALRDGTDPAQDALVAMAVRQEALELLERQALLDVAAEQTRVEADWRDLKLDQSRTMYEMEVTADLGYSMSRQTKARRDRMAVDLCRTLTQAQLDALQGKPVTALGPGADSAGTEQGG